MADQDNPNIEASEATQGTYRTPSEGKKKGFLRSKIFWACVIILFLAILASLGDPPTSSRDPEVFNVSKTDNKYPWKSGEVQAVLDAHGWTQATYEQLEAAQAAGANWCRFGFVLKGSDMVGALPYQISDSNCPRLPYHQPDRGQKSAIAIWGVKPKEDAVPAGLRIDHWSPQKWSQHD